MNWLQLTHARTHTFWNRHFETQPHSFWNPYLKFNLIQSSYDTFSISFQNDSKLKRAKWPASFLYTLRFSKWICCQCRQSIFGIQMICSLQRRWPKHWRRTSVRSPSEPNLDELRSLVEVNPRQSVQHLQHKSTSVTHFCTPPPEGHGQSAETWNLGSSPT